MLSSIVIIPSTPLLVPQLAGGAELTELRHAVCAAAEELPDRWVAVGVGPSDDVVSPSAAGTFAGYGVDLAVGLSLDAHDVRALPLCALITGWVRAVVRRDARAEVYVFARDGAAEDAARRGSDLRADIDTINAPVGVLVVADGANTLSPSAPGGYDPASVAVQAALDDALASGDLDALADLPPTITGQTAWQALAALAADTPRSVRELYRGAPFGVGYFVGVWET